MLMAARRLQGIGLVMLLLMLAMALYPLSLRVASKRSELAQVERDIVRTRDNIRYLETELGARASLRQLERWNAETFAYSAPVAGQYLESERQLAMVGTADPKLAQLAVVAPVQVGAVRSADASVDAAAPASVRVASDVPAARTQVLTKQLAAATQATAKASPMARHRERVDLLDRLASTTRATPAAPKVKTEKAATKLAEAKTPARKAPKPSGLDKAVADATGSRPVRLADAGTRKPAKTSQPGEPEGKGLLYSMMKSSGSRRTP